MSVTKTTNICEEKVDLRGCWMRLPACSLIDELTRDNLFIKAATLKFFLVQRQNEISIDTSMRAMRASFRKGTIIFNYVYVWKHCWGVGVDFEIDFFIILHSLNSQSVSLYLLNKEQRETVKKLMKLCISRYSSVYRGAKININLKFFVWDSDLYQG